ncbi:MAG: infB [Rickettsiaceae bacterium]|nr:infB [Rickettsiaceae bacterium]
MDKENKETSTRSKLTLKLKVPATAPEANKLSAKNAENKRISNSLVQVTIKGRKKEPAPAEQEIKSGGRTLSKNEFEARKNAVGKISKQDELQADEFDVLSKIKKAEKASVKEVQEQPEPEIQAEPTQIEPQEPAQFVQQESDYQVDSFDVRSKIKQSIVEQNRIKEEREKVLQERQRLEQEKLALEKSKKNVVKKQGNKFGKFEDEESEGKKVKEDIKKEKFNSRRLLQTFIVDDEDGGYRKKNRRPKLVEQDSNKEYKKIINEVVLPELITVSDLADRMAEKTGDVVKKLFLMGLVATSNQVIDADTAELVIHEFGHTVKRVKESDVEDAISIEEEDFEKLERAPVVTIMGHVDHGKTSLLDAIRSTDIVSGESGGITQHIGASRIKTAAGKYITFLDTPGHEAFTEMRSRGANATDIVVLVVAADDGVKQQTVEAISHAKAAGVPIIVAVNKIDKPGADPSRVKHELLQHEVIAEDLGGDIMFIEVSAKQKTNLDKLEEAILVQAEILELKAPYQGKATGVVIETKIDHSKGVVATVLVQRGTLDIGDIIVAGTAFGKIKKMHDDKGKNITRATPSMPVEILGLDTAPDAGDQFVEVTEEKQARDIISYRERKKRDEKNLKNVAKSTDDIFKQAGKSGVKYLPIIIKGDVHGSVEAISGSLVKLNTEEVAIKIIHSATGGITDGDVSLAAVSGAVIIGFNVRANATAKEVARVKNIDIRYHSIIYNVIDELKLMLGGMLEPIKNEEYLGQAEIRQVFKVSGSGKIGGCTVIDGMIKKGAKVRLLRDNVVIYDGTLKTLKRFKDDVKEVKTGFECGCALDDYEDIKEGDIIECYEIVEQKRSL